MNHPCKLSTTWNGVRFFAIGLCIATVVATANSAAAQCIVDMFSEPLEDFGVATALDGDILAIGSPNDSTKTFGEVHVYHRDSDRWIKETILTVKEIECQNAYGARIIIHGDLLAVADPLSCPQHVYLYRRMKRGEWVLHQVIDSPQDIFGSFGAAISIHNDLMIIGAHSYLNSDGEQPGAAHVYRNIDDTWTVEATLVDPNGEDSDGFGFAVAVRNDIILVGGAGNDGPANGSGAVFSFEKINGQWVLTEEFQAPDAQFQQWFGFSIALSNDGEYAAVGAPQDLGQQGSAYIFQRSGHQWQFIQKLVASNPVGPFPQFGAGVVFGDDLELLSAAPFDFEAGSAVHVYHFDGEQWNESAKILGVKSARVSGDEALMGNSSAHTAYLYRGIQNVDCNNNGEPDGCDIAQGVSDDNNSNGVPDECENGADFNGDDHVNIDDLLFLLDAWGTPDADLNGDAVTDVSDLLVLLSAWGPVG